MTTATYTVPSQSRPGIAYQTTRTRCTCPDFAYRGRPCKHLRGLPAHRPVRIVGQARERAACPTCLLPQGDCLYGGRCAACGIDRHALRDAAREAARFDATMLSCWQGQCGRNG